jgi:probable F420-dependent oxidoreductase
VDEGKTMKAGVVYPQIELGGDTGAVKAFAQAAEGLGYDHIVIYDHVLGAVHAGREPKLTGPYTEKDPFHEPLVTYAYLAGVTKTLGLATGVIILPQRQTVLLAKQAADVDLFSGGRLRLGVGVGWNWVEYDGLEMSGHFRRRGKRQEQQIALMRKLWEQPVIEHEDSDHRIDRAGISPRPERSIPIWFGGFSDAAYDRAARIGDGFMFSGRTQTEAVHIKAKITAQLRELGRDADAFGFESIQQYNRGDNQWPGDIAAWRAAGGSHISVVTMGANLTTVDDHIDAIRRWRQVYDTV